VRKGACNVAARAERFDTRQADGLPFSHELGLAHFSCLEASCVGVSQEAMEQAYIPAVRGPSADLGESSTDYVAWNPPDNNFVMWQSLLSNAHAATLRSTLMTGGRYQRRLLQIPLSIAVLLH